MLGRFQQSQLRIEVDASEADVRDSLICPSNFKEWLLPQTFSEGMPASLQVGSAFVGWVGPVSIRYHVLDLQSNKLVVGLSEGIDGFHYWAWGEGWVQSVLEGISLLPLNLSQTYSLLRLRYFLSKQLHSQRYPS